MNFSIFRTSLLTMILIAFASACTTVPVERGKPIQFENNFFDPHLSQDGKRVSKNEVIDYFESLPATQDHMKGYRALTYTAAGVSLATTITGIVMISNDTPGSFWTDSPTSNRGYWVILGGAVTSLVLQIIAENKFSHSLSEYNRSVNGKVSMGPSSYQDDTGLIFLGNGLAYRF
jgi:hypothetical protein